MKNLRRIRLHYCRGKIPKSTMGLEPRTESSRDQKGKGGPKDFQPNPVEPNSFKKTSEEECLLGHTKYWPNMRPIHSEESSQTNVGSRISLTKQEEGRKCKTSGGKPPLPH